MNTNSEQWRNVTPFNRTQFCFYVLGVLEERYNAGSYSETLKGDPLQQLAEGLLDALFNCFIAMKQRNSLLQDRLVAQSAHMSQSEPKETP